MSTIEDRVYFIKKTSQWLSGEVMTFEYRTLESNGEVQWKELRPNSIVNTVDEVERISGMIIDITDRKKHEEKLAQINVKKPFEKGLISCQT